MFAVITARATAPATCCSSISPYCMREDMLAAAPSFITACTVSGNLSHPLANAVNSLPIALDVSVNVLYVSRSTLKPIADSASTPVTASEGSTLSPI